MNNELPFKVKCVYIDNDCLTVGKEYNVVEVDDGFYKILNDSGEFWWYYNNRFEILDRESNLKDKQEFSVGDKVVINKVSDGYVSHADKNVKVGDVATVVEVNDGWWFYKTDVSLVGDASPLSHQEVIQAVIDGKELEIQYADGTWDSMSPVNTTLHQLTTLNFRLKPSKEDKRKAVINNYPDLDELLKRLEVGKKWKEIGCNNVVTITEIESGLTPNLK